MDEEMIQCSMKIRTEGRLMPRGEKMTEDIAAQKRRHGFREAQIQLERIAGLIEQADPLEDERRAIVVRTLRRIAGIFESESNVNRDE